MALEEIDTTVQAISHNIESDFVSSQIINSDLKQNLDSYNMTFNTLPPTDRVIIPDIDVNVPLLQSSFNGHIDNITKEDMDKDLYQWVVQYPTTPHAGEGWNTLIFWHTSYEAWKHNPYATVFAKLPKLNKGQTMQVIQNGKLYEYEVIEKKIMAPSKVNEEYLKTTNGNYLTLLGCYPIWSDKQRIMIIGKLKE
jgi:LPXTG-site transpeptidase (sortase) family protein